MSDSKQPKDKEVGFTASTLHRVQETDGKKYDYYYFIVPEKTVKSLDIEKGQILQVEVRNMEGETTEFNKKATGGTGDTLRIYLPKEESDLLSLSKGSLIDVFVRPA